MSGVSVGLAIAALVALLVAFVPYFLGGLLAGYGQDGGDGGDGGGPGGFAGYGIVAIVLGVGIPGWALVWGIVDVRRTRGTPGAALLVGAVALGIALCTIVPGSVTIIRTSVRLQAAYERENPRSEVLATARAEARASETAASPAGRAAERNAPARRAATKQRLDAVSQAVLDALAITPDDIVPAGRPLPTGSAAARSVRVTPSTGHCDAGYGPKAGVFYRWDLFLDDSVDPVRAAAAVRAAVEATVPGADLQQQKGDASSGRLEFTDDVSGSPDLHGIFTWGDGIGSTSRIVALDTACH
ncbi:hypothetical protein EDF31_102561 [Curtobacterium sp. PhB142]|uniref:hypothetical protein n=1 Tax=unclassified Curtobacterium TaxID=257496 RepID=UPI00104AAE70|nr:MULTISPECIES: hypothetical protein [unclassified Curtobacterium]TCL87852.1 hypothetical protein EDF31_102561 [Curtobacterium sp. PhB142]TCM04799.1 hypothetical protein EDF26_10118 [Curtobacterium sp. PhB134]